MISLRISSPNENILEQVARKLLEEQMIIDVNINRNLQRLSLLKGKLLHNKQFLMTAKTKAVLFQQIDDLIREFFPTDKMEIYSLPIIHMDWDEAKNLQERIPAK